MTPGKYINLWKVKMAKFLPCVLILSILKNMIKPSFKKHLLCRLFSGDGNPFRLIFMLGWRWPKYLYKWNSLCPLAYCCQKIKSVNWIPCPVSFFFMPWKPKCTWDTKCVNQFYQAQECWRVIMIWGGGVYTKLIFLTMTIHAEFQYYGKEQR